MTLSPELIALRDRAYATATCEQWAAQQGWQLRRSGGEQTGPCPVCGGTDRFSINTRMNVWNCRGCGVGGDVIFLVMHTQHLKFVEACELITGDKASTPISPEELAQLEAKRLAERAQQERVAAQYRENARRAAHGIWMKGGDV